MKVSVLSAGVHVNPSMRSLVEGTDGAGTDLLERSPCSRSHAVYVVLSCSLVGKTARAVAAISLS